MGDFKGRVATALRLWQVSSMEWILEVGEEVEKVRSRDALATRLEGLRAEGGWVVRLAQRVGKLAGWQGTLYRLLGLSTEMDGQSVLVRATGDLAAVSLLDEDFNETLVVDSQPPQEPEGSVEFALGNGASETRRRADTISTEKALSFLLHFFDQGTRAPGYRYVKVGRGGARTAVEAS